ncbi:hypothetical protein BH11ARM1_BH11ARM1_00840 [soil metagenome]
MDLKSLAVKSLVGVHSLFLKDLNALPEEAFSQKFGGETRTVADIVYEVNLVNDHIGMVVRGEEPFPWPEDEGFIKAPSDFVGKEAIIAAFDESMQKIIQTAELMTSEELEGMVTTESGETTRFQRFQFIAFHMWYHSGQFNFIQALRGDGEWHW